ncbi:hypothetical protein Bca4012_073170 [Brassica carinata]
MSFLFSTVLGREKKGKQNGDNVDGDTSHGDGDDDEDESPDDSSDDDDHAHGGYTPYEPTGDRAMEGVRDYITNEMGRAGRLPY